MESNDRRQRQNNPSAYAGQQGLMSTTTQYPSASGADRFRQTSLAGQSASPAPNSARYPYGYGSEGAQFVGSSIPAGGLQYSAEYSQEQPSSARSQTQTHQPQHQQQQQYTQYGPGMLYNVPAQQQATPQSPYESVQPYQHRQSAAMEALTPQFGVSQQYYVQGDAGSAGAGGGAGPTSAPTGSAMAPQNVPSQYPGLAYTSQESPVGRQSLASSSYVSGMSDSGAHGAGAYGPHGYGGSGGRQQQQQHHPQQQQQPDPSVAYDAYQVELKRTFENVRDGRLSDAGRILMEITGWLLGNAELLGLVKDDESQHDDRLRLWEAFNRAWLAVLQAEKDALSEALATGQRALQTLLGYDALEQMGRELVRHCDSMEKHGLVDYQLGVWEEEIVGLLTSCLDLLEDDRAEEILGSLATASGSSPAARRRG